jgi:anaerobic ribonucleoside-triphosphate reductase
MSKNEILNDMGNKRQKCIIYTRVMGYHRPVESFNVGKTGEHKQRKQFIEQ